MRTVLVLMLTICLPHAALAAVDVNTATLAELDAIRGIGPELSARILTERNQGAFKNWDDLVQRVKGIKPRRAAKLSEAGLTVGTTATPSP